MKIAARRALPFFALLGSALAAQPAKARSEADVPPITDTHWIETESSASAQTPETTIRKWPELSQITARAMIAKYGEPNRFGPNALIWLHNGPWEKSIVYRNAWPHSPVKKDQDYLKQVIGYRVPDDKVETLRRFDRRLEVDETTNELSFQSDNESTNFLALNLADDIVTEKRSVDDARDFFRKTLELQRSGKSSEYLEGFLFDVPNERTVVPE
jgi:hypothetical protein